MLRTPSSLQQRARAVACGPAGRLPLPTNKRLRLEQHQQEERRNTTRAQSSPIQFSSQFAQILQQSLARQSETTAEAIGLPGLVLEPGGAATPTGSDDDGGGGGAPADASVDDGTGSFVWGAGASLAALLWRDPDRFALKGKTVLELGAGTAVVSIVAAAAGARLVVATDLPSRLAAVERNVALNRRPGRPLWSGRDDAADVAGGSGGPPLRVAALDWAEGARGVARVAGEHLLLPLGPGGGGGGGGGSSSSSSSSGSSSSSSSSGGDSGSAISPSFDWVLGADLTYAIVAMAPLARTVRAAMGLAAAEGAGSSGGGNPSRQEDAPPSSSSSPTVLLAHRPRSREVDAAMHAAFAGEGLELRADADGTARLASLLCGGGEMEGEGDGEPMVLFRCVAAAAPG